MKTGKITTQKLETLMKVESISKGHYSLVSERAQALELDYLKIKSWFCQLLVL